MYLLRKETSGLMLSSLSILLQIQTKKINLPPKLSLLSKTKANTQIRHLGFEKSRHFSSVSLTLFIKIDEY